jgi:hypothetical protein
MKLDLLTNATAVDDAVRFVSQKSQKGLKSSSEGDKQESKEPGYDRDEDQLEEARDIKTNQAFWFIYWFSH